MLSQMQGTQHPKRTATPLPCSLARLVRGPENLLRGVTWRVPGSENSRRPPQQPVRAPEFLRPDPEFQPLDPERHRKERRYAM